jgi:hypothetical protein
VRERFKLQHDVARLLRPQLSVALRLETDSLPLAIAHRLIGGKIDNVAGGENNMSGVHARTVAPPTDNASLFFWLGSPPFLLFEIFIALNLRTANLFAMNSTTTTRTRNSNLKDSKIPVEITVTESHCKKGQRGSKNNCIIAIAAKEQAKGFITNVKVGLRFTTFTLSSGDKLRYSTPSHLGKRLEEFDNHGTLLSPGVYRFNPPRKSETIEYQRKKNLEYRAPGYTVKRHHSAPRRAQSRRAILAKLEPVS